MGIFADDLRDMDLGDISDVNDEMTLYDCPKCGEMYNGQHCDCCGFVN